MKNLIFTLLATFFTIISYAQLKDPNGNLISHYPKFDKCKDVTEEEAALCFKTELNKFVKRHFIYPKKAKEKGLQGKAIVSFCINAQGKVEIINVSATDKIFEENARRLIEKLPQLIPAEENGIPTPIMFAYPINYSLGNNL